MRAILKAIFITILCFVIINKVKAQTIYTADSISSGNTKDVITNFFQLAFNNFTGKNKQFNFASNPFALMVKSNPNLLTDTNYAKYTNLRRLNFAFGLQLDTNYKFNGFSSGIKFSIVDKRDSTTSKILFDNIRKDSFNVERDLLQLLISTYREDNFPNTSDENRKMRTFIDTNITALFNDNKPLSKMDSNFVKIVESVVEKNKKKLIYILDFFKNKSTLTFKQYNDSIYTKLKNAIKTAPLWIIGLSDTMYKDRPVFSNVSLATEYSKGVFNPKPHKNNFELNIKASLNFSKDTLQQNDNLKRVILNSQAGLNWVVRDRVNEVPYFELKAAIEYNSNLSNNLYKDEIKDLFTFNGTTRLRIYNDIWIPLEIKYDPINGKVFGFLSVKSNFKALSGFIKGK